MKARIEVALEVLVGQPLWGWSRSVNMLGLQLGEPRARHDRNGVERIVGSYGLHVMCPWRLCGAGGLVVGSGDNTRVTSSVGKERHGSTRGDTRLSLWFQRHQGQPLRVAAVAADAMGSFELMLEQEYTFQAFPSSTGRYSEHWRLLRGEGEKHFVVGGRFGIRP